MKEKKDTLFIQRKNSSLVSSKDKWEKASYISTVFSSISVIAVVATLAITMYPQLIWGNDNYIEKANAGDVYSQMFLAEHYYEIGDYSEAIYWYKIASIADSQYKAYAYNNLGVLYAKGYGLSDNLNNEIRRYEISLDLFQDAAEIDETFNQNIFVLLKTNSKECFPNINYDALLGELGFFDESLVETTAYEYREITKGAVFWEGNKKFTYSGYVYPPNQVGIPKSYYVYFVQTYKENELPLPDYSFAYLQNLVLAD